MALMRTGVRAVGRIASEPAVLWRFARLLIRSRNTGELFSHINTVLLFVGVPRTGHTMVAEFVNAHPNAMIARTEPIWALFRHHTRAQVCQAVIDAHEKDPEGFRYRIPGQFQGRSVRLEVIGARNARLATESLANDLSVIDLATQKMEASVKVIQVVMDPLMTVEKVSRYHRAQPREAADFVLDLMDKAQRIRQYIGAENSCLVYYEDVVADPVASVLRIYKFLQVPVGRQHLEACAAMVRTPAPWAELRESLAAAVGDVRLAKMAADADLARYFSS